MLNIIKNVCFLKTANQCFDKQFLQQRRFKKILKHAYKHSKFYRELYSSHGIKESDLDHVNITDLPIINKSLMMENIDKVFTVNDLNKEIIENYLCYLTESQYGKFYQDKYMLLHTSGSTGVVGYFVYGRKDWEMLLALTMTRLAQAKPKLNGKTYRVAYIGATESNFAGCSVVRSAPRFIYDNTLIPIHKPQEEILDQVNRLQPEILSGYASALLMLAEAQLQQRIDIQPKFLYSSGEAIPQKTYELTKEAWGLYPSNFYACTESMCMGLQRRPGDDIELFDDYNVFELLDENLQEVDLNQEGNLVLTNLYNFTQPIIRYQINDVLQKSHEPTSKRGFLKVRSINGRKGVTLVYKNHRGENIKIIHNMLLGFLSPGVQRFQFFQTKPDELLMKVKLAHPDDRLVKEAKSRVDEILAMHNLQGCVKSKIEVVDEFYTNPKTGKFELIHPFPEKKAA